MTTSYTEQVTIGDVLAGYRLKAVVGRGGMGSCIAPPTSGSGGRSPSS
jgi:hypothetical protein